MWRIGLVVALLAAAHSDVFAQVVPLQVATEECGARACHTYRVWGSAVYLGTHEDEHVFLTAAHNLIQVSPGEVRVVSQDIRLRIDGRWLAARSYPTQEGDRADLAVLKVRGPVHGVDCLPLTDGPLQVNSRVLLVGFPHGGSLHVVEGRLVNTGIVEYPIGVDQRPFQGESGGAVILRGELAGIISSYPQTEEPLCLFSDAGSIRAILWNSLGSEPDCSPQGKRDISILRQVPAHQR